MKLFLVVQSFFIKFCLFWLHDSYFFFNFCPIFAIFSWPFTVGHHLQSDTRGVHARPGRPLIYAPGWHITRTHWVWTHHLVSDSILIWWHCDSDMVIWTLRSRLQDSIRVPGSYNCGKSSAYLGFWPLRTLLCDSNKKFHFWISSFFECNSILN